MPRAARTKFQHWAAHMTDTCSAPVLEATVETEARAELAPPAGSEAGCGPGLPPASGGACQPWCPSARGSITPNSASVITRPSSHESPSPDFPLLRRTLVLEQGQPNPVCPHLNSMTSAKAPFPNKAPFTGTGGEDLNFSFWGTLFNPQ